MRNRSTTWSCLALVLAAVIGGCGTPGQEEPVSLESSPSTEAAGVVRYRGAEPRIAANESWVLASDNGLPASYTLHESEAESGDRGREVAPPRPTFRPDVVAVGDDFVVVAMDCRQFRGAPDEEPECDPGAGVVFRYAPGSDTWDVLAEGLGGDAPRVIPEVVSVDEGDRSVVVHLDKGWDGNELVTVDVDGGEVQDLPPSPLPNFATVTEPRLHVVCPVAPDEIAVLEARSEEPGSEPIAVATLGLGSSRWSEPVSAPDTEDLEVLSRAHCIPGGVVVSSPKATLTYRSGEWRTAPGLQDDGERFVEAEIDGRLVIWIDGRPVAFDTELLQWIDGGEPIPSVAAVAEVEGGLVYSRFEAGADSPTSYGAIR